MEDCFENENGKIVKDPEVIVSHAVLDFFGIVGMGNWSVKDGLEKLIKRELCIQRNYYQKNEKGMIINFHIKLLILKILVILFLLFKIKVKKLFLVIKICFIIIKDLIIFLMVFGKENN